jgi:hypothetical protein
VRSHRGSPHDDAAHPAAQSLGGADPYAVVAALAEAERDLALAGRYDELEAVQARRTALVAGLPAQPPAGAEPHLRRAAAAQAQATAALAGAVRVARTEAVRVDHGRGVVAAYRPAAPAWPGHARRG